MKRILLSLMMAGGLAMLMAPMAQAAPPIECGKSYAFTMNGTEPLLTADNPNHYIAAIGQITFGPGLGTPTSHCAVTHLEMLYNDNDILTFWAGPAGCYTTDGFGGLPGVPCFNGADHQMTPGDLAFSPPNPSGPDGNGSAQLTIDPSFTWVNESWTSNVAVIADLPLTFTLQAGTGGSTVMGNSAADVNGPSAAPPASPVLVITLQKQSTTAVVPVTAGPVATGCGAFGCTGGATGVNNTSGGGNGYGIKPYLGASISLFQGFGAPSADPFSQPIQGSFGSTISALQIWGGTSTPADGLAGGSASFSSNDNVGNTGFTGDFSTNDDCDTAVVQTGNFADAASNDAAQIVNPGPKCTDATNGGAGFTLSAVQWGATDTSEYVIVTGLESLSLTGGKLISVGLSSNAQGISSTAGKLSSSATVNAIINTETGALTTKTYTLTNTSPVPCNVSFNMASVGPAGPGGCHVSLAGGNPTSVVKEGDTALAVAATVNCTCSATPEDDTGVTSTLTVTSTNCPVSLGAGPITVQCHN